MQSIYLYVFIQFIACCMGSNEMYKGQQVWRVDATTNSEAESLKKLFLDPAVMIERHHHDIPGKKAGVSFRVAEKDFDKVRSMIKLARMKHKVIVEDVQTQLDLEEMDHNARRMKRSAESVTLENFDYSVYHNLEEIYEWMDLLAEKYESVSVQTLGKSLENRTLNILHIATEPAKPKPVFYMDSAIHAREWIAPATLMYVCNQLLSEPSYAGILDKLDFYFVPVVNVDGYVYTWTNSRLWRKTRRPYNGPIDNPLCVGVDANRNWDSKFAGEGALSDPCTQLYHGPYAESEPVIHHLANFMRDESPKIKAVISFHNYGQILLYPYNHNLTLAAPTESELNETGTAMVDAMKAVNGINYKCGRGSVLLYVFSGTTTDWTYENTGAEFSYTLELRDQGTFGFELPADQIMGTAQEVMPGIEILARKVISKYANDS